jgi:hypothetical protein
VKLSYIKRNYLKRKREARIALKIIDEEQEKDENEIRMESEKKNEVEEKEGRKRLMKKN